MEFTTAELQEMLAGLYERAAEAKRYVESAEKTIETFENCHCDYCKKRHALASSDLLPMFQERYNTVKDAIVKVEKALGE